MKILLLCEPRSGSTNLANWFYLDKRFTVLFLPTDPNSKWHRKESPKEYFYKTEHLLVKEDFYSGKDYSELVSMSEKIIFLFRENETDQIDSWCNSKNTGNWHNPWVYKRNTCPEEEIVFFKQLKNDFKKVMESNQSGISISYEDLYQNFGINKIIYYLEINDLKINLWPVGKKYRVNIDDRKTRNII